METFRLPCVCVCEYTVIGHCKGPNMNEYIFERSLDKSLASVIQDYADSKSTLVFCVSAAAAGEQRRKYIVHSILYQPTKGGAEAACHAIASTLRLVTCQQQREVRTYVLQT
eukprot:GHVU01080902.1.p5 GENE.GHVU01080902.1~~GHVU01080902.1.p5  ORF type:complete len:112 (+),score=11.49 GHVU01080902.1:2217-2552(+)